MTLQSTAGFVAFAVLAWLISENRSKVSLKIVCIGIVMQLTVGFVLLKLPMFRDFFLFLNRLVLALEESTVAGTSMVFGYLGGAALPFDEKYPGASFILAFKALPLILLMSALSALLFYWKILPLVVKSFSWCLQKTMGLGGTEGLGVSANIFVGMVAAFYTSISSIHDPKRAFHHNDNRDGDNSWNSHGSLCQHPWRQHSGCHGPYSDCFNNKCSCGCDHF